MQKTIASYHNRDIDMSTLGCTLPNVANNCLHEFTEFYPFTEADEELFEKIREHVVAGPSVVLTRKATVDDTFSRKSMNKSIPIVGIDSSQRYSYSTCPLMPTGLYRRWDLDPHTIRFTSRQNKTRIFENMVMSCFQRSRPDCKIESLYTTGRQKIIACFGADGFCFFATFGSKPWAAFITFVPVKRFNRLSLRRFLNVISEERT